MLNLLIFILAFLQSAQNASVSVEPTPATQAIALVLRIDGNHADRTVPTLTSPAQPEVSLRASRRMTRKPSGLTHLGKPSVLAASPGEAVLDRVPNLHPDTNYVARFAFPDDAKAAE